MENNKSKLGLILGIIAGALALVIFGLLIILGIGIYFMANGNNKVLKENLSMAHDYMINKDYNNAISTYEYVVGSIDPKNEEAYLGLIEAHTAKAYDLELTAHNKGDYDKVMDEATKAMDWAIAGSQVSKNKEFTKKSNDLNVWMLAIQSKIDSFERHLVKTKYYYDENGALYYKEEFDYDIYGNKIRCTYNDDYNSFLYEEWEYNAYGELTDDMIIGNWGDLSNSRSYEYDDKGNLIKTIPYDEYGNPEYYWYEYKYDENGNELEEHICDKYGSKDVNRSSEYDENGNCIKSIKYGRYGDVESWYEYEYDEKGQVTVEILHDADDSRIYTMKYEYDDDGNVRKNTYYNPAGELEFGESISYDEYGNIVEDTSYNKDGKLITYKYSYDYDVVYVEPMKERRK